jgi:hypothetical protein
MARAGESNALGELESHMSAGSTMNIKELAVAGVMGAMVGLIFIILSYAVSRPLGGHEVVGASVTASIVVTFALRRWMGGG